MLVVTTLILTQCADCKGFNHVAADTENECKVKLRFSGWDIDGKVIRCPRCKAKIELEKNPNYFRPERQAASLRAEDMGISMNDL